MKTERLLDFVMQMLNYLAYKLLNEVAHRCARNSASAPMLNLFGPPPKELTRIKFDLSHTTTHLGDRMFFFPLIVQLVSDGYKVSLSRLDQFTNLILTAIYDVKPLPVADDDSVDLVVIPKPSFLALKKNSLTMLTVNFADRRISSVVSKGLVDHFYHLFGLHTQNSSENIVKEFNGSGGWPLERGGKYIIFSNYISSGKFRKFFLSEKRLFEKCVQLKSDGCKIIHVGSGDDKTNDARSYTFVDLDLRGQLTLAQLIQLMNSKQVEGSVTYDNFLMHLTGIYQKTAYVLFRGRFSRANREHHFLHVNNTFFKNLNQLIYL